MTFSYETEPNNSLYYANAIPEGTSVIGQVSAWNDYDFYGILVASAGTVEFNFSVLNPNYDQYSIDLFDNNGVLQRTYWTSLSGNYSISTAAAGAVYAKVSSYSGRSEYLLSASFGTSSGSFVEVEPNNSFTSADTLRPGIPVVGQVSAWNDYDFYAILVSSAGIVDFDFSVLNPDYDQYSIEFYNNNGVLQRSYSTTSSDKYSIPATGAGVVYAKVSSYSGRSEYLLSASSPVAIDYANPPIPTYSLESASDRIMEGDNATFVISSTNVAGGTVLSYTITGVQADDLVSEKLTGTAAVGGDGKATINIPTVIDKLLEGSETIVVTINGVAAQATLTDNISISQLLLHSAGKSLYKTAWGAYAIADGDLNFGDIPDSAILLRASANKAFVPKGITTIVLEGDGSFGLISQQGTGSKAKYTEQLFDSSGLAVGKATKLTLSDVLSTEMQNGTDINGDDWLGDVVVSVLDPEGYKDMQTYGLYTIVSGKTVLARGGLNVGDSHDPSITLFSSGTKPWLVPKGSLVEGIAFTDGGSLGILTLKGTNYSEQKFNVDTGLIIGKATVLRAMDLEVREFYYNTDLTGDGLISLIGQSTTPTGWDV